MFRSLGESLLEVLRAELTTLQEDLTVSGRHLGIALGLFGAAVVILFWIVGLLITVLVAVLYIWLQLWAAALIVLLLFAACAGLLAWRGLRQVRQVENPVTTVRRHVDDHLDWLQNNLLRESRPLDVVAAPVGIPGGINEDGDEEDLP
jgi:apolipoprotein N-acyltransferase